MPFTWVTAPINAGFYLYRIPDAHRLGAVGEGWAVAQTTLMNERVTIGGSRSPRGALLGPLLATFVLLPSIGFQWSLILCAGAYALLSMLVSERASCSLRRPIGFILTGLYAALILVIALFPYPRG